MAGFARFTIKSKIRTVVFDASPVAVNQVISGFDRLFCFAK
jgi:hypothetical protein